MAGVVLLEDDGLLVAGIDGAALEVVCTGVVDVAGGVALVGGVDVAAGCGSGRGLVWWKRRLVVVGSWLLICASSCKKSAWCLGSEDLEV